MFGVTSWKVVGTCTYNGVLLEIIVGFFIFISTCILERVFSHLEGMCSDCK